MSTTSVATPSRPKENQAIPLRHPWRWVFAAVLLVLLVVLRLLLQQVYF